MTTAKRDQLSHLDSVFCSTAHLKCLQCLTQFTYIVKYQFSPLWILSFLHQVVLTLTPTTSSGSNDPILFPAGSKIILFPQNSILCAPNHLSYPMGKAVIHPVRPWAPDNSHLVLFFHDPANLTLGKVWTPWQSEEVGGHSCCISRLLAVITGKIMYRKRTGLNSSFMGPEQTKRWIFKKNNLKVSIAIRYEVIIKIRK